MSHYFRGNKWECLGGAGDQSERGQKHVVISQLRHPKTLLRCFQAGNNQTPALDVSYFKHVGCWAAVATSAGADHDSSHNQINIPETQRDGCKVHHAELELHVSHTVVLLSPLCSGSTPLPTRHLLMHAPWLCPECRDFDEQECQQEIVKKWVAWLMDCMRGLQTNNSSSDLGHSFLLNCNTVLLQPAGAAQHHL